VARIGPSLTAIAGYLIYLDTPLDTIFMSARADAGRSCACFMLDRAITPDAAARWHRVPRWRVTEGFCRWRV